MRLYRILLCPASFFAVLFCVGMFFGGDRLLAAAPTDPQTRAVPEAPPPMIPAMQSWASAMQGDQATPLQNSLASDVGQAGDRARHVAAGRRCDSLSPVRDANGNVLQQSSYMLAVYRAFALGDAGG